MKLSNYNNPKCCSCGKFISNDIEKIHINVVPDTAFTRESIEYYCRKCWKKIKGEKK